MELPGIRESKSRLDQTSLSRRARGIDTRFCLLCPFSSNLPAPSVPPLFCSCRRCELYSVSCEYPVKSTQFSSMHLQADPGLYRYRMVKSHEEQYESTLDFIRAVPEEPMHRVPIRARLACQSSIQKLQKPLICMSPTLLLSRCLTTD